MKYSDNRSQIWYKILSRDLDPIDGELVKWYLPKGCVKGQWVESEALAGTMLVSNPSDFLMEDNRAFIVEYQGNPLVETPGIIWARRARLVREATAMDLKRFGVYRNNNSERK